jgi:hypothetical protein
MPYCPHCGAENTITAKYCVNCGRALPAVSTEAQSASSIPHPGSFKAKVRRTSFRRPSIITHLGLWGSLMIIAGFFTYWINSGYFFGEYNNGITGLDILRSNLTTGVNESKQVIVLLVAIVVILLSAVICFFYIIGLNIGRGAFWLFKVVPLLIWIGVVTYIVIISRDAGIDAKDAIENSGALWKLFGVGIYLTLVGSLLLAFSRGRR